MCKMPYWTLIGIFLLQMALIIDTSLASKMQSDNNHYVANSLTIDESDNSIASNAVTSAADLESAAVKAAAAAESLRGPYFDSSNNENMTALVGKVASLHCRVRNLGNKTVLWIRHRDIHLLTVGRQTYTSDQRFTCVHLPQTEEWILKIRYPQAEDSGVYECQVSTTPPIGHSVYLSVVEPVTTILGGPEMHINKESTMNITCIVHHSPEPPLAIFWTHNGKPINYDSPRGGVSVITEKGDITISYLLVQRVQSTDSGKYTCNPSNANSQSVQVHVLNGEHPAAMQTSGQTCIISYSLWCLLILFVIEIIL